MISNTCAFNAWSVEGNADWYAVREQADIFWQHTNPLLDMPGSSCHSFYEDLTHSDALGARPILAGSAFVAMCRLLFTDIIVDIEYGA